MTKNIGALVDDIIFFSGASDDDIYEVIFFSYFVRNPYSLYFDFEWSDLTQKLVMRWNGKGTWIDKS